MSGRRQFRTPERVVNTSQLDKEILDALTAALCDPGLAGLRRRIHRGEVALCVEDGEVTWIDARRLGLAIAIALDGVGRPE